ncbi:GD12568 [Drosophila simulans]|uniref:GD12568 n=1 Tax=Drosophila simulans TaxID=7240 RepID=B4QKL5_DROSI|nr:GD12568 [Drosophila simulans]
MCTRCPSTRPSAPPLPLPLNPFPTPPAPLAYFYTSPLGLAPKKPTVHVHGQVKDGKGRSAGWGLPGGWSYDDENAVERKATHF